MRIDPIRPAHVPPAESNAGAPPSPRSTSHAPAGAPAEDRVELTGGERSPEGRAVRLEALREAVAQGRYRVTDDALARAILRAVRLRHDRPL